MKEMIGVLIALLSWQFSETSKPPVALVLSVKGDVTVKRGKGAAERIYQWACLSEDDIVMVGSNGSATLIQPYAPNESLRPKEKRKIKRQPPTTKSDAANRITTPDNFAEMCSILAKAKANRKNRSRVKMAGPNDIVIAALGPRNSLVIEQRPRFEWTPVKGAKRYVIEILDTNEQRKWLATTGETRMTYPDPTLDKNAPVLLPGEYTWEVTAEVDAQQTVLDSSRFSIATPVQANAAREDLKKAKEYSSDPRVADLLYVLAAFRHRLYQEAEVQLRRAIRETDDETLWELLMEIYQETARPEDRNLVLDYLKDRRPSNRERILRNGLSSVLPSGSSFGPHRRPLGIFTEDHRS